MHKKTSIIILVTSLAIFPISFAFGPGYFYPDYVEPIAKQLPIKTSPPLSPKNPSHLKKGLSLNQILFVTTVLAGVSATIYLIKRYTSTTVNTRG